MLLINPPVDRPMIQPGLAQVGALVGLRTRTTSAVCDKNGTSAVAQPSVSKKPVGKARSVRSLRGENSSVELRRSVSRSPMPSAAGQRSMDRVSNCRLDVAQRLRPRGRQSAATVEQLVATELHFVETVLHVVATVEQLVDTLLQDVATVEQVVATVEHVVATVEHAVATVEHLVETVEHVVATVEHVVATVPAWRSKMPVVPGLVCSQPTGCAGREARSSSLNEARKSASRQARITRAAGSSSLPPWFPACSNGTSRSPLATAKA